MQIFDIFQSRQFVEKQEEGREKAQNNNNQTMVLEKYENTTREE